MLNMSTQKTISGSAVVRFSENGGSHDSQIADGVDTLVRLQAAPSTPAINNEAAIELP